MFKPLDVLINDATGKAFKSPVEDVPTNPFQDVDTPLGNGLTMHCDD